MDYRVYREDKISISNPDGLVGSRLSPQFLYHDIKTPDGFISSKYFNFIKPEKTLISYCVSKENNTRNKLTPLWMWRLGSQFDTNGSSRGMIKDDHEIILMLGVEWGEFNWEESRTLSYELPIRTETPLTLINNNNFDRIVFFINTGIELLSSDGDILNSIRLNRLPFSISELSRLADEEAVYPGLDNLISYINYLTAKAINNHGNDAPHWCRILALCGREEGGNFIPKDLQKSLFEISFSGNEKGLGLIYRAENMLPDLSISITFDDKLLYGSSVCDDEFMALLIDLNHKDQNHIGDNIKIQSAFHHFGKKGVYMDHITRNDSVGIPQDYITKYPYVKNQLVYDGRGTGNVVGIYRRFQKSDESFRDEDGPIAEIIRFEEAKRKPEKIQRILEARLRGIVEAIKAGFNRLSRG